MSKLLKMEKLNNTRDLGGMETIDGRSIRPGFLFRSGHLQKASEADLKVLSGFGIAKIIDFRATKEVKEQPDPPLGSAQHIHLPAEDEQLLGIERDEESEKNFAEVLIDRVVADPDYAREYMCGMYRRFISNDFTVGQYRKFIRLVDECDQPVLWHCTAGKDRAGFASIIMEEILGIPREKIREDYLITNTYIKEEVEWLIEMFARMYKGDYPRKEVRFFFSADEAFIDAIYDEAEIKYGSFENYLTEALGVDEAMKDRMKARYLR